MRRRLRKKKRLGEFREYGFAIRADVEPGVDHEALLDRIIAMVETQKLGFGGGVSEDTLEGFIARLGRGSCTEDDRVTLRQFFAADPAILRCAIGPLECRWAGHAPKPEGLPLAEAKAAVLREMGRRVRLAREQAELTQATLASKLGVTRARLIRAESGTTRVSGAYLRRVLEACKLPADWTGPESLS